MNVCICSGCGTLVMGTGPDRREPDSGVVWCGTDSCTAKQMYIDAWLYVADTNRKVRTDA